MTPTTIGIRTLTPIWTGDADGKCTEIKETGIIGSMRWWYEAIVRGLGGYACDPTADGCKFDTEGYENALNGGNNIKDAIAVGLKKVCPACQLFGCTGWRRRFRMEISDIKGDFSEGIKGGFEGRFKLKMCETDTISDDGKWLFYQTLKIIAQYGAIGGRTTRKPQRGPIGQNYGLANVDFDGVPKWNSGSSYAEAKEWISENKRNIGKKNDGNWFDFRYYWVIEGKYMNRLVMNNILGLNKKGKPRSVSNGDFYEFLRGQEDASKKIFSFDKPKKMVFGYVRNEEELGKMINLLKDKFDMEVRIKKGGDILLSLEELSNA